MEFSQRKKLTAIRSMTNDQLEKYMSNLQANGILIGMNLYKKALDEHPKIYKPAIAQVNEIVSKKLDDILGTGNVDSLVDSGDNADG